MLLVIPAQAGIQFLPWPLSIVLSLREQSFHSSCGGAGYFSCLPKRSNQEKGTPNVAPSGHPALRVRPRATGPHEERRAPARRSNSNSRHPEGLSLCLCGVALLRSCFCAHEARCFWVPAGRGEAVEDQARRGTRTMRVLRRTHMDVRPANPGAASRTRSTGTVRRARPIGVPFLLVTSLWASKEK